MDQGLAALLGASVAVVGALCTGGLTYVATRRQAMDNGEVAHRKQLREERRDAYKKFLAAAESLDRVIFRLVEQECIQLDFESRLARDAVAEVMGDLDSAAHNLYVERMNVALAGPFAMGGLAHELWHYASSLQPPDGLINLSPGWLARSR